MLKSLEKVIILISIVVLNHHALAQKSIRIVNYNILEGMRIDTTNNKTDFVSWVKNINPDVLTLQEVNGFTQRNLELLAIRYGHPYAILVKENGYPTAITSKYPIVNVRRVLDNITHGFIQCKIEGLNFIVLHLNAHSEDKRLQEIATITQTIKYADSQSNWLIMGDFNSVSPLDDSYFRSSRDYTLHKKILEFGLIDVLKINRNVEDFISTCPTPNFRKEGSKLLRYDFIYMSKDLKSRFIKSEVIQDDFTSTYSDHYPVMMELFN
ncbi:MAG TPA: endonuclease/exonuclease/phosphatase family protein [Sphingobacterium sp.]|nr:endonuclease/exonuclease/phosphatase family protein [Sphingobacterium sp.]